MERSTLLQSYQYYKNQLSPSEQKIYEVLYQGLLERKSSIGIKICPQAQVKRAFFAVIQDNPMCFAVRDYIMFKAPLQFQLKPNYKMKAKDYEATTKKVEILVADILKTIQTTSLFASLMGIHRYILTELQYELIGLDGHQILGPLLQKKGVCEGISKLVKLLCDQLNIPCILVEGVVKNQKGKREAHNWNGIFMDGLWYHFDFTFDLCQQQGNPCPSLLCYHYFALTTEQIAFDHFKMNPVLENHEKYRDFFHSNRSYVENIEDLKRYADTQFSRNKYDLAFRLSPQWNQFNLPEVLGILTQLPSFSISYQQTFHLIKEEHSIYYIHFQR